MGSNDSSLITGTSSSPASGSLSSPASPPDRLGTILNTVLCLGAAAADVYLTAKFGQGPSGEIRTEVILTGLGVLAPICGKTDIGQALSGLLGRK